jgi:hypothetical protein
MKQFLFTLPLIRFFRHAQAAPFLADRCNLLQEKIDILEMHLAISRSMLATVMRERDTFEGALDRTCRELAKLKKQRQHERGLLRTWLTRCAAVHPSEN